MPEIIIEQNQNIINYINMLNSPYSKALRNHMPYKDFKTAIF